MKAEESIIASFIEAIEGTKSTAEFYFENLTIQLPGVNTSIIVNGKVSITALPVHDREKQ